MKAKLIFHEKRVVKHSKTEELAITEIKVWNIPKSKDYPEGRKYSLFLVLHGEVIIGFDNHKPKGPHCHINNQEIAYHYRHEEKLMSDFWDLVKKEGFEI